MNIKRKLLSLFAAALIAVSPIAAAGGAVDTTIPAYAAGETTAQADHSELLTMCKGSYAYNELGKLTNGAARQKLYNVLFDAYSSVWTDGKDYTEYKALSGNNYYYIDNINITELGISEDSAAAKEEFASALSALLYDNPVFYYTKGEYYTSYSYMYNSQKKSYVKNTFLRPCINEAYLKASYRKLLQQDIYDYIIEMTAPTKSFTRRFERALIIHDKMLPLMTYNKNSITLSNKKAGGATLTAAEEAEITYSHNIIGAVEYQTGVCESYAKTYQMLLNYIGIDNIFIMGTETESNVGHGWNAVKMDNGVYYFVDPTWDDKLETHKFFAKGHTVFDDKHTVAGTDGDYYFYPLPSNIPQGDYSCQANNPTLYTQMSDFSFYINKDNTVTIRRYLGSASKVTIPTQIMGFKVTEIGADAFWGKSGVSEVVIPDGITTVGSGAFFITNLTSVTIPKSVTSIGSYAFGWMHSKSATYNFDGNYSALSPIKKTGFTVYCYSDSAGYRYAVNNGFKYVLLDASVKPGDVDNNGKVDIKDVMLIQQSIVGWNVDIVKAAADVNADGAVNIKDVMLIQQYIVGWNVTLKTA